MKTGNKFCMKKLLVFLFIILLLCCTNLMYVQNLTLENIFPNASVEVYTSTKSKIESLQKIDNGIGEIIFCDINQISYIFDNEKNISGLTIKINIDDVGDIDLIKSLHCPNFFEANFGTYGWSAVVEKIFNNKFGVLVGNMDCNFQIFKTKNEIFVGIPILLGGY